MTKGCAVKTRRDVVWFGEKGEWVACLGGVFVLEGFFFAEFGLQGEGRQETVREFSTDVPKVVFVFELEGR